MADSAADRAAAVTAVVSATSNQPQAVQEAALQALVGPPSRAASDILWVILVTGLVLILVMALKGLIDLGDGQHAGAETDKIVTVISSVLAGLLGFFIRSPIQK